MPTQKPPQSGFEGVEERLRVVRAGVGSQLGALLDLYRGYLMKVAAEKLSPEVVVKTSPSDLVQETLCEAVQGFAGFAGATEPELRAWLRQILNHRAIDVYRLHHATAKRDIGREVPLQNGSPSDANYGEPAADSSTPAEKAIAAEDRKLLATALAALDPKYQEVIQLRSFDQLNFEEVGRRLGVSDEAARKLWTRAIRRLAEELRRDDPPSDGSL